MGIVLVNRMSLPTREMTDNTTGEKLLETVRVTNVYLKLLRN